MLRLSALGLNTSAIRKALDGSSFRHRYGGDGSRRARHVPENRIHILNIVADRGQFFALNDSGRSCFHVSPVALGTSLICHHKPGYFKC